MELEEKIEVLESALVSLKVEIKGLLIDLKELALRGQDPVRQSPANEKVARAAGQVEHRQADMGKGEHR